SAFMLRRSARGAWLCWPCSPSWSRLPFWCSFLEFCWFGFRSLPCWRLRELCLHGYAAIWHGCAECGLAWCRSQIDETATNRRCTEVGNIACCCHQQQRRRLSKPCLTALESPGP